MGTPHAFLRTLVGRGKKPLHAYVPFMRRLRHVIHGMLATDNDFVAEKFYVLSAKNA